MSNQQPCAVVFCAQHEKVLAFYRDAIGAPVVHHEDSHSVLDASGLLLVVHPLPDTVLCAPEPVTRRWDCVLKLMFPVASIAEARAKAGELGSVIDAPDQEWTWDGRRCCKGHDPEGNVFEVFEAAT